MNELTICAKSAADRFWIGSVRQHEFLKIERTDYCERLIECTWLYSRNTVLEALFSSCFAWTKRRLSTV